MSNAQNQVEEPIENLTPEAKAAEEAALKGPDEEQVRAQVIEKYGLDPDQNQELVDKLVADTLEGHKKLSTAIKQKIGWRTKASKPAEPKPEPKPAPAPAAPVDQTAILQAVDERFEQRELDSLEMSDELKAEIKKYAQLNKVSVKEAAKSEYITFLKEKAAQKAKLDEANVSPTRKSQTTKDYSELSPEDFDRSTPEGRKEWEAYKIWLKNQK